MNVLGERMPATCYKWWQRCDSDVWWRFVSGRVSVELWAFVAMLGWMRIHPGTDVVSSGDDGGCRHDWPIQVLTTLADA
jgi:hypothetical protein